MTVIRGYDRPWLLRSFFFPRGAFARADERSRTARASRRVDMMDDGRRRTTDARVAHSRGHCDACIDDSWETHTSLSHERSQKREDPRPTNPLGREFASRRVRGTRCANASGSFGAGTRRRNARPTSRARKRWRSIRERERWRMRISMSMVIRRLAPRAFFGDEQRSAPQGTPPPVVGV